MPAQFPTSRMRRLRARLRAQTLQGAQLDDGAARLGAEQETGQVKRHAVARQAQAQLPFPVAVADSRQLQTVGGAILALDGGQHQGAARHVFHQRPRARLPQEAVMPAQQVHPRSTAEPATGVGTINLVQQAGMDLRQCRQARRRGNESLPARALRGEDDGAQRGLDTVAMLAQWRLLLRGAVAGGGKSMHANGSTTGLMNGTRRRRRQPGTGACTLAGALHRVVRMIGGGENEGGYKLVMCCWRAWTLRVPPQRPSAGPAFRNGPPASAARAFPADGS